jgi:integrase
VKNETTYIPFLWLKKNKDGLQHVKIKITKNRKRQYESLGIFIHERHWSKLRNRVLSTHPDYKEFNHIIERRLGFYEMRNEGKSSGLDKQTLFSYLKKCIEYKENELRFSSSKRYNTLFYHLKDFRKNIDIKMSQVDKEFVLDFRDYLYKNVQSRTKQQTASQNSIRNYLKVFRTVLTKAKEDGYLYGEVPFVNRYIPEKIQSAPKYIKTEDLWKVNNLNPSHPKMRPLLFNSLNIFMFCFWSQGIRIGDCLQLKWGDLEDDFFIIRMQKTKRILKFPLNTQNVDRIKWYVKSWIPIWDWSNKQWNLDSNLGLEDDVYLKETEFLNLQLEIRNEIEFLNSIELPEMKGYRKIMGVDDSNSRKAFQEFTEITDLENELKNHEEGSAMYISLTEQITRNSKYKVDLEELHSRYIQVLIDKIKSYAKEHHNEFIFPFLKGFENSPSSIDVGFWKRYNNKISSSVTLINKSLNEISQLIDVPKFTCHQSRHTLATYLKSLGTDIYDLKNWLGHRSVSTTELYAHSLNPYESNKTIEPLWNLLNSNANTDSSIK